jgi:hypothetical protein
MSRLVSVCLAVLLVGCGWKGLAAGYSTLVVVRDVGRQVETDMAEYLKGKVVACVKAHGSKTKEAKACIEPEVAKVKVWAKVRAGVNAEQLVAFAALKSYHDHLAGKAGGKKINVIKVIARSVCALVKGLEELKAVIGSKKVKAYIDKLSIVKGLVCI